MRYQDSYRQHRVVMAPVAPADDVDAIGPDVGKRGWLGKVVGHPDIWKRFAQIEKAPLAKAGPKAKFGMLHSRIVKFPRRGRRGKA
jgi:hypothetical protein